MGSFQIDGAYENFLEDIEQELNNVKRNIIEELNKKLLNKKDHKLINNTIEMALKKFQIKQ